MPLVAPPVTSVATRLTVPTCRRTRITAFAADTSHVTSRSHVTVTSMFSVRPYVSGVPSPSASRVGVDVSATSVIQARAGASLATATLKSAASLPAASLSGLAPAPVGLL